MRASIAGSGADVSMTIVRAVECQVQVLPKHCMRHCLYELLLALLACSCAAELTETASPDGLQEDTQPQVVWHDRNPAVNQIIVSDGVRTGYALSASHVRLCLAGTYSHRLI